MALSVRLGPGQVERAGQIAVELAIPVDEVYRRALHGLVQLGAATEPYRRYPLRVTPTTLTALRRRADGGDVAPVVRGIFSGDIAHL